MPDTSEFGRIFGRIPGRILAREQSRISILLRAIRPPIRPVSGRIRPCPFPPIFFFSPFEIRICPKSIQTSTKHIYREIRHLPAKIAYKSYQKSLYIYGSKITTQKKRLDQNALRVSFIEELYKRVFKTNLTRQPTIIAFPKGVQTPIRKTKGIG
mgnify:CR=1 FL=1